MFGKKTVDTILAGFNKMIEDLENIKAEEVRLNVEREEEIERMRTAQIVSSVEIGRAQNVINNLKVLTGEQAAPVKAEVVPMSKRMN